MVNSSAVAKPPQVLQAANQTHEPIFPDAALCGNDQSRG